MIIRTFSEDDGIQVAGLLIRSGIYFSARGQERGEWEFQCEPSHPDKLEFDLAETVFDLMPTVEE